MKTIVPLRARTWAELEPKLDQLTEQVDLVEIWLDQIFVDFLRNPALLPVVTTKLQKLKKDLDLEVLAVCKSPTEQGQFGGTATQRIELLKAFLQLGGDSVDIDIKLNHKDLIRQVSAEKLWLSLHDFAGVPADLEKWARDMKMINPAVYKFAVTPQSAAELESFINFAKSFDPSKKAIFTTMGALGETGRAQLKNITWAEFYALNEGESTASGQPLLIDRTVI
jgi:3-dehydroquinate dehydratase type I